MGFPSLILFFYLSYYGNEMGQAPEEDKNDQEEGEQDDNSNSNLGDGHHAIDIPGNATTDQCGVGSPASHSHQAVLKLRRRKKKPRTGTAEESTDSSSSTSSTTKQLEDDMRSEKQTALSIFTMHFAGIVGIIFSAKATALSRQAGRQERTTSGAAFADHPRQQVPLLFLMSIVVSFVAFLMSSYNLLTITFIKERSHSQDVLNRAKNINCLGIFVIVLAVVVLLFNFIYELAWC